MYFLGDQNASKKENDMCIRAFDSHCHIDLLLDRGQPIMDKYSDLRCGGLSWAFPEHIDSWYEYPSYWQNLRTLILRLRESGLPFFYLVGIHPRCIPYDLSKEQIMPTILQESLEEHMSDPLCSGLGELGLESGSFEEEKILEWQLSWALSCLPKHKRLGIHTPRNNKRAVSEQILRLLSSYEDLKDFIVIDHLTSEIWDLMLQDSYMLGMTLQEGKASVNDLMTILADRPQIAERLMINSDSAISFSEPYFTWLQKNCGLKDDTFEMLAWRNAVNFFHIPIRV